jgi:hypothetical protein
MPNPITATRVFETAAPAAAVWAALENALRWPEVLTDLVAARIEPDGVLRAGAILSTIARPGTQARDMRYRVVAAAAPHRLSIESAVGGPFRARTDYAIAPLAAGARVTVTSAVEAEGFLGKVLMALRRAAHTRQLEASLDARVPALLALAERIAAEG